MRSFRAGDLALVALPVVLAACGGRESLPDDPRPAASHESAVPLAAVSAVLPTSPPKKPYLGSAPP